ncbi:MAG: extracellular solute-binding protein [bacterium]|nr:extracellular solute-binding protein [bacterium]
MSFTTKFSTKQIIIIAGAGLLVVSLVVLIVRNIRTTGPGGPVFTLKIWGFDERAAIESALSSYKNSHPLITLEYTRFDPQNYQSALVNALASGEGPDIFYLSNRELPRSKKRLSPLTVAEFPDFGLARFRELFPEAPERDFVVGQEIYALPLYLDTLALIYNKDLFDQAGITSPPKTWFEFQAAVAKLRAISPQGQIVRAAAAMGGTEKTVDAGVDLLNLLMLQNGAKMINEGGNNASFAADERENRGGHSAFNFYLQFANAGSPYYTWNDAQLNSLDSFASGKTAMIFNYQSAVRTIKNKSPFLNFGVAGAPQSAPEAAVNYPRYYGLAVSKQSKNISWAWDFILHLTTDIENGRMYSEASGRPPALRPLIEESFNSPALGVFAKQALTARSWYEADDVEIQKIFNTAIRNVLTGQASADVALAQAQEQVSQLMRSGL